MMKKEDILNCLMKTDGGFRPASGALFQNDHKYFPKYKKEGVIAFEDEDQHRPENQIFCNIMGCESYFQSALAYQSHYNAVHRYICSHCKKSLPTPHLLDIHLSENHDSYFSVLSKKSNMYVCFIEECLHRSATADERKDHCISVHKFPRNFRFESLCMVSKNVSAKQKMAIDEAAYEKKDQNAVATTADFSFGHGKGKTFNKKSYSELSKTENKNMLEDSKMFNDLLNSLPD